MLRKLLLIAFPIVGLVSGLAAGHMLRSDQPVDPETSDSAGQAEAGRDYLRLNNQFIIPVLVDGRVGSLVLLSLSLEVSPGGGDQVFSLEPKLRDAFLQVLFDHANTGGFRGAFTEGKRLSHLRTALTEAARKVAGPLVHDVLITEINRQDS